MDYKKIYDILIERAKTRLIIKENYYESHHIIPKCMGGKDTPDNLVKLTAKEHFICHQLLCEIHPKHGKLRYALWMMTVKGKNQKRDYRISSRQYARIKEGMIKTKAHKAKISKTLKMAYASGKRKKWNKGKKMNAAFGKAISVSKKGMVGTNLGIPMSEAQKNSISETLKNKPLIKCPYCNRESRGVSFKYYHFKNCKQYEKKNS